MVPTSPEIEALRAELTKASDAQNALSARAQSMRKRAPEIDAELAEAMVDNDGRRIDTLRRERAEIDSTLRDVTGAIRVAEKRRAAADRALARAEYPVMLSSIRERCQRLNTLADEANRITSELKAAQTTAMQRFNRAEYGTEPGAPDGWRKALTLSGVAATIFRAIVDVSA